MLLAQKGQDGQPTFTAEEVEERMKFVAKCLKDLSKMQVLDPMEPEWAKRLEGEGAKPAVAESLAEHIRCLIGNPVPNEQGEGQSEPVFLNVCIGSLTVQSSCAGGSVAGKSWVRLFRADWSPCEIDPRSGVCTQSPLRRAYVSNAM